jgi:hypothetical protein
VPLAEIDMKASYANPGRLNQRLDQERAASYGLKMEEGIQFPAIVLLYRDPHGPTPPFVVAGGLHRTEAALLAHLTTFPAYVVAESNQYRRDLLIRMLNMLEGNGYTRPELMAQILQLHRDYPKIDLRTIAREWNTSYNRVKLSVSADEAEQRAVDLDMPGFARLPTTLKAQLGRIAHDPIFVAAVDLSLDAQWKGDRVVDLVRDVIAASSDEAALDVVRRMRADMEIEAKQRAAVVGAVKSSVANLFQRRARGLARFIEVQATLKNLAPDTREARQKARDIASDLTNKLQAIIDRIDDLNGPVGGPHVPDARESLAAASA